MIAYGSSLTLSPRRGRRSDGGRASPVPRLPVRRNLPDGMEKALTSFSRWLFSYLLGFHL